MQQRPGDVSFGRGYSNADAMLLRPGMKRRQVRRFEDESRCGWDASDGMPRR
jgi:hypothetical protein